MALNNYLIERKDQNNNWQLIESSVFPFDKYKDVKYEVQNTFHIHPNRDNIHSIYKKLSEYEISIMAKHYIEKLIDYIDAITIQSVDKIFEHLSENDKETFLNSIEYTCKATISQKIHTGIEGPIYIKDIVSTHKYLDVLDAQFLSNDLKNFRIIFIS